MSNQYPTAPALAISHWLNCPSPITLESLRGRVVMLHTFQMLCPGCVMHALPQASRARESFSERDLSVIGLHTVFEHHDVMDAAALAAFVQEYRLSFPIGIDQPGAGAVPLTMQAYELRGTPSVVLIDRQGRVRTNHFGRLDDMVLGALLGQLIAEVFEADEATRHVDAVQAAGVGCNDDGCVAR